MNFLALSSSRGTTFQATLDRIADGSLKSKCIGLITDSPDRGCIQKAKAANIPVVIVDKKPDEPREDFDKRLQQAILQLCTQPKTKNLKPETGAIVACMGWLWILSPWFIRQFPNRILNVHPALLPKYGGKGMFGHHVHDAVLAAKEKESGITIHLMDEGVDTGKILLQKSCPVLPDDTAATLQARVQELEKKYYPKLLQMIDEGSVNLE
ncbi:MAG: phosphoribosylglycinamide formyltransferase [Candidatus Peribacteraceae bacterium]|nr:phosphoribosylglycinamide formyltransferase [Candidatus Peribacteraceae bacterium]